MLEFLQRDSGQGGDQDLPPADAGERFSLAVAWWCPVASALGIEPVP
jgi:hypothetical protein